MAPRHPRPNWADEVDVPKMLRGLSQVQEHAIEYIGREVDDATALQRAVADLAVLATAVKDLLSDRVDVVGEDTSGT